jgi:DNA-binding MarR family transcriptional regulator
MAEKAKTARGAADREPGLDPDIEALLIATTDVQRVTNRLLKTISRKRKLTERGLHIINLIRGGLNRPSRLIEYFDVLPSTITSDTEKLVAAGLIERQTVPTDRRVTKLALTRRGLAVRQEALAHLNGALRERLAKIPPEDLRICVETLRKVIEPLEPETPPSDAAESA